MNSDPCEAIALLRYRIVAAATDPRLTPAEHGQLVRELAGQAYDHPDGSRYTDSRGTLDRWVRAYREQGLDGLRPPPRADLGTVRRHPELLEEAAVAIRDLQAIRSSDRGFRDSVTGVVTSQLLVNHGQRLSVAYLFDHPLQVACRQAGLVDSAGRPAVTAHRSATR